MGEITIVIRISGQKVEHEKEIINSIRGFVKSLAKRFGFEMEVRHERVL